VTLTFVGWTAGSRADAEAFAREVAAENGWDRAELTIRPAPYGWDVFR
jgi:hypothetical protein